MNFDFLKDLSGLSYVYENCINAEKLAMTMPVQSVMTSRKSAELLAKFIYMTAHRQEIGRLTFENILFDTTVKKYINNSEVMDAFHYIRMSGNEATHAEVQENTKEAIDVLKDLHYVAGEIARRVGLIDDYPDFDHEIASYPDAVYVDEQDIERKAKEMFDDYVMKYCKEIELNNYYNHRVDKLRADYDNYSSIIQVLPSVDIVNESIEFKTKPVLQETITRIQARFGFLGLQAVKKLRGELDNDIYLRYSSELTIYGEGGYSTSDIGRFLHGIFYDLPNAQGFKIISSYYGPSLMPYVNTEIREDFRMTIDKIGENEVFTYKLFDHHGNSGESYFAKYENGQWIDLEEQYSEDIIDKDFGQDWWSYNMGLGVSIDFEKHPDVIKRLHEAVRKHIPADQLEYCEREWYEPYENYEITDEALLDDIGFTAADVEEILKNAYIDYVGENPDSILEEEFQDDYEILCNSIQWCPRTLRVVQNFLDEVNHILEPIMHEVEGGYAGKWYISDPPAAVAMWTWTEDGFKIVGTEI